MDDQQRDRTREALRHAFARQQPQPEPTDTTLRTLPVPAVDPTYVWPHVVSTLVGPLTQMLDSGERVNALITGPHGSGKTELAAQLAARLGYGYARVDVPSISDVAETYGTRHVRHGATTWRDSLLTTALEAGHTVVLLDEINRVDASLKNLLYAVLDGTRGTYLQHSDRWLSVAPSTLILATANQGSAYAGTFAEDAAMLDRFPLRLPLGYLTRTDARSVIATRTGCAADTADMLSQLLARLQTMHRQGTLTQVPTLRAAIPAARLIQLGTPPATALTVTILEMYSADAIMGTDERAAVASTIAALGVQI